MNARPPHLPHPPDDPDADPVAQANYENAMKAWKKKDLAMLASKMSPPAQLNNMTSQDMIEAVDGVDDDNDGIDAERDEAIINISDALASDGNHASADSHHLEDEVKQKGKSKSKSTSDSSKSRSTSFRSAEFLILSRAYMEHSNDAISSTDQKSTTFWGKVTETYNKLVLQTNKVNEGVPNYVELIERTGKSLTSCWNRRVQKAVSKFTGICSTHPPSSGEVRDDQKMDRYYKNMRKLYYDRSENSKDLPRKFDELMSAYNFLKEHPKFAILFPPEGKPKSAKKTPKAALQAPERTARPPGRNSAKASKQVQHIVSEVVKEVDESNNSQSVSGSSEMYMEMLANLISQGNETMQAIQKNQIMAMAPSPQKKKFFNDLITANVLEARNKKQRLELDQQKLQIEQQELDQRKRELDRKETAEADNTDNADIFHDCDETTNEKCCYPDCAEEHMIGFLDKCANPECDHDLKFHHCCQITYMEAHGKEIPHKRCYQCALDIVMGLNTSRH